MSDDDFMDDDEEYDLVSSHTILCYTFNYIIIIILMCIVAGFLKFYEFYWLLLFAKITTISHI